MTRYLGIDPGTTRIGYGVVEETNGVFRSLAWGIIETKDAKAGDKEATATSLRTLIDQYQPDRAGVERLFFMNNQRTAMAVSEMRGVIMLTLQQASVPVLEFTPQQVKLTVCGHGGASKQQIQDMVQMVLHIKERVTPDDAADGLALALCCATAKTY